MSLLSPEFRLALLPDRAGLAARGRAPLARAGAGLEALESLLSEHGRPGRARVILSHHLTRLFLLPPPPAVLRRAEVEAWLRDRLATVLDGGATPADWCLTWDAAEPDRPILAAAMEKRLLDDLAACLGRLGLSLAGVRPWLAVAWSRRPQLRRANGWYALLEPDRLTLLRLQRGRPESLRQRSWNADPVAELVALLTRESLLAGVANGGEVWLERAGVEADWSDLGGRHRLHVFSGAADPALALLA